MIVFPKFLWDNTEAPGGGWISWSGIIFPVSSSVSDNHSLNWYLRSRDDMGLNLSVVLPDLVGEVRNIDTSIGLS